MTTYGADQFTGYRQLALGLGQNPSIVRLKDGGFLVSWSVSGNRIDAQVFDKHGDPAGPAFTVSDPLVTTAYAPAITPLANGSFVVVWNGRDSSLDGISARLFSSSGGPLGDVFTVNTTVLAGQHQPSVAALADGGFVVSWSDANGDANGTGVVAQIFDSSGAKVGNEFDVNVSAVGDQNVPHLVSLQDGGFVISWSDTSAQSVRAQFFTSAGAKVGGEILVSSVIAGEYNFLQSATVLASGNILFVWAGGYYENYDIRAQILSPSGARIGSEFLVNTNTSASASMPQVTAHGAGGLIVTWRVETPEVNAFQKGDVVAQIFDASGARVGEEFLVNSVTALGQWDPQVASFGSDDFATAWLTYNSSGSSSIALRLFYSTTSLTGLADTFNGTSDVDYVRGLAGNDTLMGGAAGDHLDGGIGADTMAGEAGNDTFVIDDLGDVVVENDSEGFDTVTAQIDYTLPEGVSVERITTYDAEGTSSINLTGNSIAQDIVGNAGGNILDGAGGEDWMYGGRGDDTYFVDSANDQIFETAGEGYDRVFASVSYSLRAGASVERLSTQEDTGISAINLTGNAFSQDIYGNDGNNVLSGGAGEDWLFGRLGDDIFYVDRANDIVFESAGQGYDQVLASATYTLHAGRSVERLATSNASGTTAINLTGNELSQDIVGNAGANVLMGGGGDDWFTGGAGNDGYYVDSANDQVFESAGQGYDTIYLSASFRIAASADIEVISVVALGGTDQISLLGTDIAQELWGNMGDNYFDGKGGSDSIYAIGGTDIFAFSTALGSNNVDRIYGFDVYDTFLLSGNIFTAIVPGTLAANAFVEGTAATSAAHRIIYNGSNGALLYDADGSGAGAAVQFATIDAGLDTAWHLYASNFVVTDPGTPLAIATEGGSSKKGHIDDFPYVDDSVFGDDAIIVVNFGPSFHESIGADSLPLIH